MWTKTRNSGIPTLPARQARRRLWTPLLAVALVALAALLVADGGHQGPCGHDALDAPR